MTTAILQTVGWTVIHFLWQGSAIALVAAMLLRLAERRSAKARYVIACAALGVMVAAPVATATIAWSAIDARLKPALSELVLRHAQDERVEGSRLARSERSARVQPSDKAGRREPRTATLP